VYEKGTGMDSQAAYKILKRDITILYKRPFSSFSLAAIYKKHVIFLEEESVALKICFSQ